MKVLFIVRSTLHSNKGGDTIQILQTASCLRDLGVEVTIAGALDKIDDTGYDLLHFFNITRPADILRHIRKSTKPFVVSPIFVDYSEFDRQYRKGISGLILRFLGTNGIEYAKTLARYLFKGEQIASLTYLLYGQGPSVRKVLRRAKMLLPNSYSEYRRLVGKYGIEKPYSVVPNAVGDLFIEAGRHLPEKDADLILCVARIEGLKNQLTLIRALNNSPYRLLIVGQPATHQAAYCQLCRETAASNVRFIDHLPQEELIAYYLKARVHVLPSWFETTGLSSLEAAALGCNIVVTDKGDTREYFGEDAWYCDPSSPESILQMVELAASSPFNGRLREKILSEYTWRLAALKTRSAYSAIASE